MGSSKKTSWKDRLVRASLMPLAVLPFPVLYALSDVLALMLARVMRYRLKVVRRNLSESFPDKTPGGLKKIERKFYRNFTDQILETVKLLAVSDRTILRRFEIKNLEVADEPMLAGRQVVVYFSHCGNWEWGTSYRLSSAVGRENKAVFGQVYRPLKNKVFDRMMLHIRGRFGTVSYPKATVARSLLLAARKGQPTITGFMSDQKPSHGDPTRIGMLLNHPTAMITGTEMLARKLEAVVVYWDMRRIKRGHYQVEFVPISDNAALEPPGAITDSYRCLLEKTILRDPAIWLWSHKRWKHPVAMPGEEASAHSGSKPAQN